MQLVLNNYGISLSRENEAFIVSSNEGRKRVPVSGVCSILICKGAQITSDAIQLAVENEVEVLFLDKVGNPFGRVWSSKYGSISTIRKGQIEFTRSRRAVIWIKNVIIKKIENQQALMLMMVPFAEDKSVQVENAVAKLEQIRSKVNALMGDVVPDIASSLRGLEGMASKLYFETLNLFLADEYKFQQRTQHPAMDAVNAFLNYGYGILYGKIEGALIEAGVDPYVGILHRDEYNRPVLVYDVIELYRIWVDYVVFTLAIQKSISADFFSIKSDGSYWLEALGRRVLIQAINDYLEEIIVIKGVSRSRLNHIYLYAQNFAQNVKI